jgi:hypothetical protein
MISASTAVLNSSHSILPKELLSGKISKVDLDREIYRQDPVLWQQEKLGEFAWSGERKMMYAVRDHRRNAFYGCHRFGKSFSMGRIAFWWLDTHNPGEALVITTAHSATQVKLALWREMARVHAKGKFPGRMNQTEYYMPMGDGREEIVAFGRKPKDDDTTAFHGTYSKHILVLGDEACNIPDALWVGLETLVSNEFSRIVMFGNPDDPTTQFAKVCKPGSGWNVLRWGYSDTPNFIDAVDENGDRVYTGSSEDEEIDRDCPQEVKDSLISHTWVNERKRDWGENNPIYISKVKGEFPEVNTDSLIPVKWVRLARERDLSGIVAKTLSEGKRAIPNELGCDVGGGRNHSTITHRLGPIARVVHDDRNPDTMQTLSAILAKLEDTSATQAKIDMIGIGLGAAQRAKEMSNDQAVKRDTPDIAERASKVVGVDVRRRAIDNEHFINLRAEGYWNLRERFNPENEIVDPLSSIDIDVDDDDLAAQLLSIKSKSSSGRIQIEEKTQPSPDKADSLMLAFLEVDSGNGEGEYYTW